ncbi:MAG: hypothetical protein ABUK01_17760 [Leptospirales bacterium]
MNKLFTAVGIMAIIVLGFYLFTSFVSSSIPFDQNKWSNADLRMKYRMARYLEKVNELDGMSIHDVKELLGKPGKQSKEYLFYRVDQPYGFKDGFSILLKNKIVISAYTHD